MGDYGLGGTGVPLVYLGLGEYRGSLAYLVLGGTGASSLDLA